MGLRIVFMGTPAFAIPSLRACLQLGVVVGVVTQPDRPKGRGRQQRGSPIKCLAQEMGCPVFQPRSLRSPQARRCLADWRPELIIVVAFGQILPPEILSLPPSGCLNVHASLLPRWRGAAPIPAAILAGDGVTGVSIIQMDEGLDTGPILSRAVFPLSGKITGGELHDGLSEMGANLLLSTLPPYRRGEIRAQLQNDALATYAPQLKRSDGEIDWRQEAAQIERQIRAHQPWPGSFTLWNGQRLIIQDAKVLAGDAPPGLVLLRENCLAIGCGNGLIAPKKLQLAGKRALLANEFARGRNSFIGALLGHRQSLQ